MNSCGEPSFAHQGQSTPSMILVLLSLSRTKNIQTQTYENRTNWCLNCKQGGQETSVQSLPASHSTMQIATMCHLSAWQLQLQIGRVQILISRARIVHYLVSRDITVFTFDFAGCGLSEGEYISLGYYEKGDVDVVFKYLRELGTVSSIGIWGRSMGAVTALMYADSNH